MTNEEAIKLIEHLKEEIGDLSDNEIQALNLAIEALEEKERLSLSATAVEDMNPDYQIKVNIPEEETQKLIEELQRCRPCILPESEFTDDDIQELIKENFNIGYEMAKNKYARPQSELAEKLKDRIEESICNHCLINNKHCELCEISRVFQIIMLTEEEQKGGDKE